MKNFFDKFDPEAEQEAATPDQIDAAAASTANSFDQYDDPAKAAAPPPRMSGDEFASALYKKLNDNTSAEELLEWSNSVGHGIQDNENFRANIRERDRAVKEGRKGVYGRIAESQGYGADSGDTLGGIGAFLRQAANIPLFNFGDEIAAGTAAAVETLGGEGSLGDNYQENWEQLQDRETLDRKIHPGMSTAGDVAGIAASMAAPGAVIDDIGRATFGRLMSRDTAGRLATRAATGTVAGGTAGAIAATGEGTPDDRFANTSSGGALGAILGGNFPLVAAAAGRVARPVLERIFTSDTRAGVGGEAAALGNRVNLSRAELDAMEAELQRQADLGLEPTILDVLPERARNVVGSAGRHDSAREQLADFAGSRAADLPDRVSRVIDEEMVPAGADRSGERYQLDIGTARDTEINRALEPIRLTPLPMTAEIMDVLGTTAGQRAIRNIIAETTDPARRAAYQELQGQARNAARGVDPRLGEAQQQKALSEITEGTNFDLDMSERIGRELKRMANTGQGSNALREFGNTVRSAAETSPKYREIMGNYAAASRSREAVSVGSGSKTVMDDAGNIQRTSNEGEGFLNEDPERFARRVSDLLDTPEVKNISVDIPVKGSLSKVRTSNGDEINDYVEDGRTVVERVYTNQRGDTVDAGIYVSPDGKTAYVDVIGHPSMWDSRKGTFGNADIIDMMRAFKKEFPTVENFVGHRVTGAHANGTENIDLLLRKLSPDERESYDDLTRSLDELRNQDIPGRSQMMDDIIRDINGLYHRAQSRVSKQEIPAPRMERNEAGPRVGLPDGTGSPSELDLARVGAADATRSVARTSPEAAGRVARGFERNRNQRQRTATLFGSAPAERIGQRMGGEVQRVERAVRQATREGPAREGGMDEIESTVNMLYNPGPISFARESMRYLHRIGMTERDANWIVSAATDPARADEVIARLRRHGMNVDQAKVWLDEFRDASVKYAVSQEGGN